MDSSHVSNGFSALHPMTPDDVPLNAICYDEDCNLAYIHTHAGGIPRKAQQPTLGGILTSLVFGFFALNFLACFWVYVFVKIIFPILHFFHVNIPFHMPFNLPLPPFIQ